MIKYHPSEWDIEDFVAGNVSPAKSLITAAHIDMCRCCAIRAENAHFRQAKTLESEKCQNSFDGMHSMMQAITDNKISTTKKETSACRNTPDNINQMSSRRKIDDSRILHLEGKRFGVPKTLARYIPQNVVWSKYLGKLWQVPIKIGGRNLAYFIYLEGGGYVPEHTHAGTEMILVIDGQFSDGIGSYRQGDVVTFDEKHTHSPVTKVGEGCLIFIIIDEPLSFTNSWARVINPLSQLYFNLHTSKR